MGSFAGPAVVLRPASPSDIDALYRWRMDPDTRAASLSTSAIPFEAHRAWLLDLLADSTRRLFVAECDGIPVGTIRADLRDEISELSWTVAPEHRGRGIGTQMVVLMAASISGPIEAVVKAGNPASVRIAEAAGMRLRSNSDGLLRFFRGPIGG